MSDNPLILGIGLGGVAIGTIFAAGYMFGVKQRSSSGKPEEDNNIEDDNEDREDNLTPKFIQKPTTKREEENYKREFSRQEEENKKRPEVIKLFDDRENLKKELDKINNKLEDPTKIPEEKEILVRRRTEILKKNKQLEKQIQSYPSDIIQRVKNKLAEASDAEYKENYNRLKALDESKEELELEAKAEEAAAEEAGPSYDGYGSEDENYGSEDENYSSEDMTRPSFGGAKKFVLTYTPTNKSKTNKHKNKKRKTKRNSIYRNN